MVCRDCVEKQVQKLIKNHPHLDLIRAYELAYRAIERVEQRKESEKSRFRRFIEHILHSQRVVRWKQYVRLIATARTQWKATLYWSFRSLSFRWFGFGSDYTQNCAGTCATGACDTEECDIASDCWYHCLCAMGSCVCPAPLSHSSQISSSCQCPAIKLGPCAYCISGHCKTASCTCSCGGSCAYNCDAPYVWNGVACILVLAFALQRTKRGTGI